MALTLACATSQMLSLEEYLERIENEIDVRDLESVSATAPLLRQLANDPTLIVAGLHRQIGNLLSSDGGNARGSGVVIYLGGRKDFYVRANIWPSADDAAKRRLYQNQLAYYVAHDHNFSFMTTNYLGPGYVTEIYEYDFARLQGYLGEPIDLRFLEKTRLEGPSVMLYRASKDIHVQYPPDELTITLNLMTITPEVHEHDQFLFDLEQKTVSGFAPDSDSSLRVSMIDIAGHVGNSQTVQLLSDLARTHPCQRTRLAAFRSLETLTPERQVEIWEGACLDHAPLVVSTARTRLQCLSESA